jgi:hypothetical protein
MQINFKRSTGYLIGCLMLCSIVACGTKEGVENDTINTLVDKFHNPPFEAHPGVYWYFMDGNMNKEEMTKDLESMKEVGISHLVFLEVNVGVPRGTVDFMSDKWLELFAHAEREARRLDIAITLGVGPGWTGSGGPWVPGKESMRHMVASATKIVGGKTINVTLPIPEPNRPFFGLESFPESLADQWKTYYDDIAVLAFPKIGTDTKVTNLERKSLVYRYPFTSDPRSIPFIPETRDGLDDLGVDTTQILDLSDKMDDSGNLQWDAPAGEWTVLRFVARNNGAITRPAPLPGVGFESDKFDTIGIKNHLDQFLGRILDRIGPLNKEGKGGLKMLHMDSWEMGAQNWTDNFRAEFKARRGYDPLPFYPAYAGYLVQNRDVTERFLWDLRITSQELILENHAGFLKQYANELGLGLSIEPYDMNPTNDMMLGSVADVPMAEFWTDTFDAHYAVIEASSIAHVNGKKIVPSEAFTSDKLEKLNHHPASLKNIGDWAFAGGVNRIVFHTFAHKPLGDSLRPGMTMGQYGVHWDRGQTWWPFVGEYHDYLAKCSTLLQQGDAVSDILFLTPEGVPHVFQPPASALGGEGWLKDKKGYSFDGVAPQTLMDKAKVENGKIAFPDATSYELMVLPNMDAITPELLSFIEKLLKDGATVIGNPYLKSPSLTNYPENDEQVLALSREIWGGTEVSPTLETKKIGRGTLYFGGNLAQNEGDRLYPSYKSITEVLEGMGVVPDVTGEELRYIHRKKKGIDIYFLSNTLDEKVTRKVTFRVAQKEPMLWHPVSGEIRSLPQFDTSSDITTIALEFAPYESYFVIFAEDVHMKGNLTNFSELKEIKKLTGPWTVQFDSNWGGPSGTVFETLTDWSQSTNDSIKFYSGTASYISTFELAAAEVEETSVLDLGEVKVIADVVVNGKEQGTVWCAPWQIDIGSALKPGENTIKITVANQWANRLIGDEQYMDDGIKNGKWPDWIKNGTQRPSDRYTFITYPFFKEKDSLQPSGLLGPVRILRKE